MTEPVKCKCGELIYPAETIWRDSHNRCSLSNHIHEPAEPSPAVPKSQTTLREKIEKNLKATGDWQGRTPAELDKRRAVPESQTGPIPEELREAYEESAVEGNDWAWTRGYVRGLIERIGRAEASVAELKLKLQAAIDVNLDLIGFLNEANEKLTALRKSHAEVLEALNKVIAGKEICRKLKCPAGHGRSFVQYGLCLYSCLDCSPIGEYKFYRREGDSLWCQPELVPPGLRKMAEQKAMETAKKES